MAFLRRDFIHPEFSSWRKRDKSMTLFFNAGGALVAAYSYNTALALVVPDADQISGYRVYLNISKYSKCSNEHMWAVRSRLRVDYGDALDFAAEADNVPVGTSADALRELCGATAAPEYVRERATSDRDHLTMRDLRRTWGRNQMHAYTDGSHVDFIFTTADDREIMLTVKDGELEHFEDCGEDWTISPDAYAHVIATQGKLAALAAARGNCHRSHGGREFLDFTYSKRASA